MPAGSLLISAALRGSWREVARRLRWGHWTIFAGLLLLSVLGQLFLCELHDPIPHLWPQSSSNALWIHSLCDILTVKIAAVFFVSLIRPWLSTAIIAFVNARHVGSLLIYCPPRPFGYKFHESRKSIFASLLQCLALRTARMLYFCLVWSQYIFVEWRNAWMRNDEWMSEWNS